MIPMIIHSQYILYKYNLYSYIYTTNPRSCLLLVNLPQLSMLSHNYIFLNNQRNVHFFYYTVEYKYNLFINLTLFISFKENHF